MAVNLELQMYKNMLMRDYDYNLSFSAKKRTNLKMVIQRKEVEVKENNKLKLFEDKKIRVKWNEE